MTPPRWVDRVPRYAGLVVVVLAGLMLTGWLRHFEVLGATAPRLSTMKANSAVGCMFAGLSLTSRGRVARWLALVPAAIGSATLVEWIGGATLGIDELIVRDPFSAHDPGRPSPQMAIALVLFGANRLLAGSRHRRTSDIGAAVALAFVSAAGLFELGWIFQAPELTAVRGGTGISATGAVSIGLLAIGVSARHAHCRPLVHLWDGGLTGTVVRRVLPPVLIAPPALGLLRELGLRSGWFGSNLGTATFVASMIILLFIVVTVTAESTHRLEVERGRIQTELREAEQRARQLADHDPLTGIWNRRRFESELAEVLARLGVDRPVAGALMIVDIDHFKAVNDAAGHPAGDRLLVAVANGLGHLVRDTGAVSRLGGDEFAVMLCDAGPAALEQIARDVVRTVAEAGRDCELPSELGISGSVGVARFGDLPPEQRTTGAALVRADEALYVAKNSGRGRYVVHRSRVMSAGSASAPR
ncbi:diguanylate cyclase domain-containing protein [Nocardioides montaniterrae]